MIVELAKLTPGGLHVTRTLALEDLVQEDGEVRGVGPVDVDLDVRPQGEGFVVEGGMSAAVRLGCARCLEGFDWDVKTRIYAEFRPRPAQFEPEVVVEDADLSMSYLEEGQEVLDLREVTREQLLLQLPMKPLCEPECHGLCIRCGANLNRTNCDCPDEEPVDPRLAALADLKRSMED